MTLWDENDNTVWIQPRHIVSVAPHIKPGFVSVSFVNGHLYNLSPFKPQERNDEAFMSALTKRTTLNEALIAMDNG